MKNLVNRAREVLEIEASAICALKPRIGGSFREATSLILKTKGRVVVSGMGKSGIVAQKFSATLASTGTPSLFLHLSEAVHGDLGRVTPSDTVVVISYSGQGEEIRQLMPLLKRIGSKIIALTGKKDSILAKHSNVVLDISVKNNRFYNRNSGDDRFPGSMPSGTKRHQGERFCFLSSGRRTGQTAFT